MGGSSDEELYIRWREGSVEAGNELAAKYCQPVLAFFASKLPEAAEDLMQKTFLACMASTSDPSEVRLFRGFLFGVARKQLLRHFEGRGKLRGESPVSHFSLAELRTTPTQRIAKEQERTQIQTALAVLPLDQQIALELYYWQKMSVGEVAEALDLSEGGTRAKLHRARGRLKEVLARLE